MVLLASSGLAQDTSPGKLGLNDPVPVASPTCDPAPVVDATPQENGEGGFLYGERSFPNFIGYLSNPTFAVDPRSLTQMTPI